MSTAGSCDGTDGMLEAGYPLVGSKCSARNNGYPFKRYPAVGRPNGIGEDLLNGFEKEETGMQGNKGGSQLPVRSRAPTVRGSKTDGESGNSKGRSFVYSILISVVVCCFLAEALLQGSVMMLWKQTDISLDIGYIKPAYPGTREGPESYSFEYKLRFTPWKFKERFSRQKESVNVMRMSKQSFLRPPCIALVCASLYNTPESLYLITIAKGLLALGYKLQLFTFEEGPMQTVWEMQGISVHLVHLNLPDNLNVDWSNFEGIIVSSLEAKQALSSFMQEPFKGLVVIWIILEDTLGKRLGLYEYAGLNQLILEWKQAFGRPDVIVFPDYTLAMMHTLIDTGNFFVIPGFPVDAWEVKSYLASHNRVEVRRSFGLGSQDIALVIVGSPFTYKGVWREHAMIMQGILPVLNELIQANNEDAFSLKLIFVSGNPTSSYGDVLQVMAHHLGYSNGSVSHFSNESNFDGLLWAADIVIYSSLRDEQAYPRILLRAMNLGRFVVAPNITVIQNFVLDGFGVLLYPAGDLSRLTEVVKLAISKQRMMDEEVASTSLSHVTQLSVSNVMSGYADLLETILPFPSDIILPRPVSEIPSSLRQDWQWELLIDVDKSLPLRTSLPKGGGHASVVFLLERLLNSTGNNSKSSQNNLKEDYETLTVADWEEESATQLVDDLERKEEEQIEERHELLHGSWEDVYKVVKKMERIKNELHERDDGELERTGQPLCIYEPYFGMGASSFLHQNYPLYRGISLSPKQKRSGYDDIDAALRLPLLNDSYYQAVMCEYGAFFAVANRVDRVHKNAWIGFQPWQASGRQVALSTEAERSLTDAITAARHGDAFYFWAGMRGDNAPNRSKLYQDFWSFCDVVNNNNCRSVFLDVFKRMYGLPANWTSLPPMPVDGDDWSVLHCWAMPTTTFLEFVMFARMFVDALDSQHYTEHHDRGYCCLGTSDLEVKHCYCRMLELLVNVWAYHSARMMIFVDPLTGAMHEHHGSVIRQGHMWINFFDYSTLKGMDEDLAEEADDELPATRRIWPQTGEVFCQGVFERERREHYNLKMEKKKKNKERLERIRSRYRQKPLAGG